MSSARKKVMVVLLDHTCLRGYVEAAALTQTGRVDLLTPEGQHEEVPADKIKSVHFVREFTQTLEAERKTFFSRPKLDGIWVRLRFRDNDTIEGIVANDLLSLLDHGIEITPPDLNGQSQRIFIPRTALAEMKVLGVVGVARRTARKAEAPPQPKLFSD